MKIIHCADIHLDSKMETHFDSETARQRRNEILKTFCSMVEYASSNEVDAIIIAGDLFDKSRISVTAKSTVMNEIKNHENIQFYYLRGNHDLITPEEDEIPANLHLFGTEWTTYEMTEGIKLTAVELNDRNSSDIYDSLHLNESDFNIVMLHGQESVSASRDKAEVINLKALRNRGIDYLALGHIHSFKTEKLDYRANYCYPGCLEGRGFDECGTHGFVIIDIDPTTKKYVHFFKPWSLRTLYEVNVDISECMTVNDIEKQILSIIQNGDFGDYENNLFRINLVGAIDVECEKDLAYLTDSLNSRVFFGKIKDKTEVRINYEDYLLEESLKGAFVRSVMNDDTLTEEDKKTIIRSGIRLIEGKEAD